MWLTGLVTTRDADSKKLQDLSYTRDLVGNITEIDDAAQSNLYHSNTQVNRNRTFTYDPLYRLSEATGREKDALAQPGPSLPTKYAVPAPGAQDALMRNYTQSYFYDAAGNLTEMKHVANSSTQWRRGYHLEADCNQLLKTSEPGDTFGTPSTYSRSYGHNWRGAMTFLPHLYNNAGADNLTRDYRDQLRKAQLNGGDAAHYVYDAAGNRVAKHVEAGQKVRGQRKVYSSWPEKGIHLEPLPGCRVNSDGWDSRKQTRCRSEANSCSGGSSRGRTRARCAGSTASRAGPGTRYVFALNPARQRVPQDRRIPLAS